MEQEKARKIILNWIDNGICFDSQDMDQWEYELMKGGSNEK